ncbi:hypothetical protein ACRN9F_23570 [Shewanella oncorhynchi]|uniref:hypothetical protein n=1 Tax=Shewanella TaxID=22 RepID=UPI00217CD501|nr:hypothetical protein [Shewanella baltica]MCS6159839.1 hypothetical protein [Shewanella baltica]
MSEAVMFSDKLVLPLLATLGASLTILFIQLNTRRVKETKQKIYTASYIMHQCYKILFSELSIIKATIVPHIKAIERILEGDEKLLTTMFLANEFDILKVPSPKITNLPDDYLLVVGYDDIQLVSIYETLAYINSDDACRQDLNECVKNKLKNMNAFMVLTAEEKTDILHEYYDHLINIEHASKRKIFFILYQVAPSFSRYVRRYQFWLYSKRSLNTEMQKIKNAAAEYKDYLPAADFGHESMNGGIQKEIT